MPITNGDVNYQSLIENLNGCVMGGPMPAESKEAFGNEWSIDEYTTLLIDLSKSESELRDGLTKTARKAVRYATEKDVEVTHVRDLGELREYHQIISSWAISRYGKTLPDFERDYADMWLRFRDAPYIRETFKATWKGNLIAGLSVYGYAGHFMEYGSFQSDINVSEKLFGPDLLKWSIILWGRREGHKILRSNRLP